ncbi:dipeptide epimerase, partial [Myxococcota bacterium]|nr:dipeptide epimerase [Myxococcota bacterium]
MHIKHISIGRLTIPLKSAFTTAVRTTASLTDLVVTITTVDGAVGFGSAALVPAVTGYDEAGVLAALERLTLFLFENNPDGPLTLAQKLSEKCLEAPPALAAMDTALYDLAAKNAGLPLAAFLGGTLAPIPILATVSLAAPEVMAREAKHLLGRGFQTLKLKVGKGVTDDQERIEAVATRVPPSISLVLDANQGWSQEEAHAMLTWLSRWPNIRLLEQPLAAADHQGLADL